jgi:hypothetical protein
MEKHKPIRYDIVSFSTRPIEITTKLWRYLTLDKFIWLLEKSQLWHTRLDLLGDPFEGSYTKTYVQMRNTGKLPNHLKTGLPSEIEAERNEAGIYSKFVTCWHESAHESAAMWKLYSTDHAGVAIVSTPFCMREAVDLTPYQHGVISPIEYLDFDIDDMTLRPISKGFGRHANPGFLKRKSFEHEHEVRGAIDWLDHSKMPSKIPMRKFAEFCRLANPRGISVNVNLKQLIEEIYLSPLAHSHFEDVVRSLAELHGLGDRVRLSKMAGIPVF